MNNMVEIIPLTKIGEDERGYTHILKRTEQVNLFCIP